MKLKYKHFWQACRDKSEYQSGVNSTDKYGADCSCSCQWFYDMIVEGGGDWGVCLNPLSHRVGLLTWEHMGCFFFKKGD